MSQMAHLITVELTKEKKSKPAADKLGFGKYYTDHMFIMNYEEAKGGWHSPRVVPYQPISLDPAAKILHYGQSVFEGMKAYRTSDGQIQLFRPQKNWERLNKSHARLCMPPVDEDLAMEALERLILVDQDWIPEEQGTSLYVRPFVFATEPLLGVASSKEYLFIIILSPVGAYYAEGINPVTIHVESEFVRAVAGGVGNAKTAGNYAAAMKAQELAAGKGFTQVLWLDGVHRKYIEEVGSMNVFFMIDGKVVTPALNGSILEGITRDSVMQLLRYWNVPVEERTISIDELYEANRNGTLQEAFGTGTAAVISPIGELNWNNEKLVIGGGRTGQLTSRIYDTLTGIQNGNVEDPFGWAVKLGE